MLERKIAPLLKRPVGRPSRQPKVFYASFRYQAKSWESARRVVAKVVSHAKYRVFQVAEVAVPRELFATLLERIGGLRLSCASG